MPSLLYVTPLDKYRFFAAFLCLLIIIIILYRILKGEIILRNSQECNPSPCNCINYTSFVFHIIIIKAANAVFLHFLSCISSTIFRFSFLCACLFCLRICLCFFLSSSSCAIK